MSARSSTWSESASSELDPLFLSLKEPGTPSNARARYSNALSSPSASSDTYPAIPATVNFPLPPRRLRPGEIVDIPDPGPSTLSPTSRSAPAPVSLYGVAIGGNTPIKTNPAINGRAEVRLSTAGMTSLDLRKMSLRNRSHGSATHPLAPCPPPETISMRARNPRRMLAPLPPLHSPSRSYSHAQAPIPRYQHAYSSSSAANLPSHSGPRPSRSPSRPPSPSSSLPARNRSSVETGADPVPRLRPTRKAYQSLSYSLSNSDEAHDHSLSSIRQPLSDSLSSDLNIHPNPQFRRHPLLSAPHRHKDEADSLALNVDSATAPTVAGQITDKQNAHIKFAPLPHKSIPSTASFINPYLAESQNTLSKQSFTRKKAAWIQRWLSPATKHVATKAKPDIPFPIPASLTLTDTGVASSSASVAAPAVQRRNSVTDQAAPKEPAVRRARPRSRSFTPARPTLGMVADLVQRSPSRSIHDTVASGKSLLSGSQCIVSPLRAHSLQNLIDPPQASENTASAHSHAQEEPLVSEVLAQQTPSNVAIPLNQFNFRPAHPQFDCTPEVNAMLPDKEGSAKPKKKREIRFRNTLELVPDLVLPDSPQEILTPEPCPSEAHTELSAHQPSRPGLRDMDGNRMGHKRRKTPIKNLGLFNHLRKPRSTNREYGDDTYDAQDSGRRALQSASLFHSGTQPTAPLLPGKTHTNQYLAVPDQDGVSLLNRKLAPKLNLTFVDLDHHIGSRFSVNTLLKEVHKSLPDIKSDEGGAYEEKEPLCMGDNLSRKASPARQYSDPVTREEVEGQSRGREGSGSEARSEGQDGFSSDNLGSPTTATSVSNPTELEPAEPHDGHASIIEVVKTNGADVVFQMVVPVAPGPPKLAAVHPVQREKEDVGPGCHESTHEADALTVISERLVALNKSIEAQRRRPSSAVDDKTPPVHQSPSQPQPSTASSVTPGPKTKRIEHWLSNVPSPQISPAPSTANVCFPSGHHPQHHLLLAEKLGLEVLDNPDLLDCPESPVDKLHRHLPSFHTHRAPTPVRSS